jgi:hypothetical protein
MLAFDRAEEWNGRRVVIGRAELSSLLANLAADVARQFVGRSEGHSRK